jgi:arrestin-related trafficking adapter 4/5/7
LKAIAIRGQLCYDLHAYKPICIIRTLGLSTLACPLLIENVLSNKVKYFIIVLQQAVMFRTSIRIYINLIPLLKGLKIKTVKCDLVK